MNRKQRRHSGKPQGMSYAAQLAHERMLREASQSAANDIAVNLQTDINCQRMTWLWTVAMHDTFYVGPKRFADFAYNLQLREDLYDKHLQETDREFADEKLRREAERISGIDIEYIHEREILEAKRRHENHKTTRFEKFRLYPVERMARAMCDLLDCEKCPGKDLCNHKDEKANGLVKWFEQEVDLRE